MFGLHPLASISDIFTFFSESIPPHFSCLLPPDGIIALFSSNLDFNVCELNKLCTQLLKLNYCLLFLFCFFFFLFFYWQGKMKWFLRTYFRLSVSTSPSSLLHLLQPQLWRSVSSCWHMAHNQFCMNDAWHIMCLSNPCTSLSCSKPLQASIGWKVSADPYLCLAYVEIIQQNENDLMRSFHASHGRQWRRSVREVGGQTGVTQGSL